MTSVPFATEGDDSFAVGFSTGLVQSTDVAVRVGGTVMLIIYGVPSVVATPDNTQLQQIVDKATSKL
jgi:hypothetical protein